MSSNNLFIHFEQLLNSKSEENLLLKSKNQQLEKEILNLQIILENNKNIINTIQLKDKDIEILNKKLWKANLEMEKLKENNRATSMSCEDKVNLNYFQSESKISELQ